MLSGNPGRLSMNFWMVPFFSPAMWYLEHLFLHHHTHTEVEEVRCTGHAVRIVETATDADLTDLLVGGGSEDNSEQSSSTHITVSQ